MSDGSTHIASPKKTVMLLAILALGVQMWAQTPASSTASQDPFGQLDKALSSAADNRLTAAAQPPLEIPVTNSAQSVRNERPAFQTADSLDLRKQAVLRVQQLRPVIEPILRQEGIPAELSAVVLVESGGQSAALSPKGARGIWQFMPDTARRYGLFVDKTRDDRTDIEKSTRAAARYLRDLHLRFGNWHLALAAYNAGELAVQSAVERTGSSDFSAISNTGQIPAETRSYVPSVLAAIRRIQDRDLFGVKQMESKPVRVIYASVVPGS